MQNQESALQGSPAMLLISGDPVENSFEVIDIGRRQNMDWVELIPRDAESQFVRVLLAFVDNDLLRMEMADKLGQVTRFQFYDIHHNPSFKSTFSNSFRRAMSTSIISESLLLPVSMTANRMPQTRQ